MEEKSRLNYSLTNSIVSTITQILTVLIGFFLQSIFIRTLGATYLGVKGLFSNILSVLSFTELGIGTAITFSLYKPLANDNRHQISVIMQFFKRAYETIGVMIGIIGIMIIPFIHLMTHINVPYIYLYYILYLLNTVVSYFFTYKRTLLNADQKNYLNQINEIIFRFLQSIVQIFILLLYKSFLGFLLIQLICTILSNILISIKVDKLYPYLTKKISYKLPDHVRKEIFSNTLGSIGSKIGVIIVDSTDNVLISFFKGLYWVGLYSNYMLVVNNLMNIFGQAIGSITASVGNLNAQNNDKKHQYDIFEKTLYINYFCTFVCSICLLTLFNSFIDIWVGKKFEFSFVIVFAIVFNFILKGLRQTFISFVCAYGLYTRDGKKAIIEAIVNFILSIVYMKIFNLGVLGVILGTISSNFLVNWYEPYMIIKYGMKLQRKLKYFFAKLLIYILINILVALVFSNYISKIFVAHNFGELCILAIITLVLAIIVFIIIFGWESNFKFMLKIFKSIIFKVKINKS